VKLHTICIDDADKGITVSKTNYMKCSKKPYDEQPNGLPKDQIGQR
jgi:hypothetical protein